MAKNSFDEFENFQFGRDNPDEDQFGNLRPASAYSAGLPRYDRDNPKEDRFGNPPPTNVSAATSPKERYDRDNPNEDRFGNLRTDTNYSGAQFDPFTDVSGATSPRAWFRFKTGFEEERE